MYFFLFFFYKLLYQYFTKRCVMALPYLITRIRSLKYVGYAQDMICYSVL